MPFPIFWNADITYNYQSPLQIAQSSHIIWFTVAACSTLKFKTIHYVTTWTWSYLMHYKFLKCSVTIGKISPKINMDQKKWKVFFKTIFLSKWVIFRFHVNFPGCTELGKSKIRPQWRKGCVKWRRSPRMIATGCLPLTWKASLALFHDLIIGFRSGKKTPTVLQQETRISRTYKSTQKNVIIHTWRWIHYTEAPSSKLRVA